MAAELDYTLDRCRVREFFKQIVTVEDVQRPKPDPEGLVKILAGRDPANALYLGDNVDDALSSWAAKIPFIGILPQSVDARRARGALLQKHGAMAVLRDITQLEAWLARRRGLDPRTSFLPTA